MHQLRQDPRVALRRLRQQPGSTRVAVLTLATGLGANTAVFALVHALILRSLPVERPRDLYRLGDPTDCCVIIRTYVRGPMVPNRSRLVSMVTLHAAPSDALASSFLRDLRTLLDTAFEGGFTDQDWDHASGGVHVWLTDSDGVISHGSLVERTIVSSGQTLRVGYVEAVATAAAHRRNSHAATVMKHIGELIQQRYVLGALSTGAHAFYERLGWERWRGPTFVDGPRGRERTPDDDGGVMVLRTSRSPPLDLDGGIVCDWRLGDVW